MRVPFGYESNVDKLSLPLVPDPVARADWEAAVAGWRTGGDGCSLLEWLVLRDVLAVARLLAALGEGLGSAWVEEPEFAPAAGDDAEARLLRQQGLAPLVGRGADGRRRVAGGAELKPDLRRYLGTAASGWEWVVVTPLRATEPSPGRGGRAAGRARDDSSLETWLRDLLQGAWANGASDIHCEIQGGELQVRTHGGAGMRLLGRWPGERAGAAMRLLKRWSGLSTAEDPLPLDGRLRIALGTRDLTFRASHLRTVDGESLVLRVLGAGSEARPLGALGVPEPLERALAEEARFGQGLILFTGPTCSGKTTTLFGLLTGLAGSRLKIMTIEDPVEYEIPFALQSVVDEARGWTFDAAVRAYLRQDPDVIVVGEIRDAESAAIACRAGLTGHCVLSTLHAWSEEAALDRLRAWGVAAGTLSETVRLVVNQRLEPAGGNGLRARFSWLEPDPEELYAFLRATARPWPWQGAGRGRQPAGPPSPVPPP